MRIVKGLIVVLCLAIVVLAGFAFVTHNRTIVEVDLLFATISEVQLGVWLLLFFIAGGLLGMLVSTGVLLKEKAARIRLEKRMRKSSEIIAGYSS